MEQEEKLYTKLEALATNARAYEAGQESKTGWIDFTWGTPGIQYEVEDLLTPIQEEIKDDSF